MKTLANYKVVKHDDGSIVVYDDLGVNAPEEIARPIAEYFKKRR